MHLMKLYMDPFRMQLHVSYNKLLSYNHLFYRTFNMLLFYHYSNSRFYWEQDQRSAQSNIQYVKFLLMQCQMHHEILY